ncbi:MAG: hypothetical protein LQ347_005234 [Umbilicaria vellea]|nr:MAG: hypothetical protein LQ347_005234 [Umbilicaria vellea]
MPFTTQFSLSLELANLASHLPLRAGLNYTASAIVNLARELKRSGSDFLVEEDLVSIFGRGKVVSSLENHFRDVVKIASIAPTPLHPGSEIVLDAAPGATLRRALKQGHDYLATVIQLSFLSWMHEDSTLAAALTENMRIRHNLGVKTATPDPDYEGILGTLQTCNSQTSEYPWELLIDLVESKFATAAPWFRLSRSPLKCLTPNILLGAMDYLYSVQSLPEDRIMIVENQTGLVPIVIWAHCILGLVVLVQGSPDGDVTFGRSGNPQVIIKWVDWELHSHYWTVKDTTSPVIYLLDGDMHVILMAEPTQNEGIEIEGQERHRLRGYGTTFLRRLLNMDLMIADDDPIYAEVVQYAVARASVVAHYSCRAPLELSINKSLGEKRPEVPRQCYLKTENIRLIASTEVLFSGIQIDRSRVSQDVEKIKGVKKKDMALPPTIRHYTDRAANGGGSYVAGSFTEHVERLAAMIMLFAQVVDVQTCSNVPLIYDPEGMSCWPPIHSWDGIEPIRVGSDEWFMCILNLLAGQTTTVQTFHSFESGPFLVSSRGWSCFYAVIGDNDPGKVNCELVSLQRGVPTNQRTNERKCVISDAPRINPKDDTWGPLLVDKGTSYIPRCIAPVVKRTELYSSRTKTFWLSIRFDLVKEQASSRSEPKAKPSIYVSYRQLQEALWKTLKTDPCPHSNNGTEPVQLDLGVSTAQGFFWVREGGKDSECLNQRICISLVKGDSRARWLVLAGILTDENDLTRACCESMKRRVILRCDGCCEDCAVKCASAMEGKWLVVI